MTAFLHQYATQLSIGATVILSAAGSAMPSLGTPRFWVVWVHDFFKLLTASKNPQH